MSGGHGDPAGPLACGPYQGHFCPHCYFVLLPAPSSCLCWDSALCPEVIWSPSPSAWLLISRDLRESQGLLDNRVLLEPR